MADAQKTEVLAAAAQAPFYPGWRIRIVRYAQPLAERGIALRPLLLFDGREAVSGATAWPRAAGKLAGAELALRRRLAREPAGGVAWVQRNVSNLPLLDVERRLASGRRLVLDVDDAIWLDGRLAGGSPLAALKGGPRKLRWLAGRADVVLAGNDYLAENLGKWSKAVEVVPSVVDVGATPQREHADGEALVLGWIGSPTTGQYLRDVLPALEQAARRLAPRPVRLLALGTELTHEGSLRVELRRWTEEAELAALGEIDIGLMPLADNPWTRGKCAYKALQYMAAGLPVVASAVGVSAAVVEGSGAGHAVHDDAGWVEAITRLGEDRDLRAQLGAAGRRAVDADYSVRRWAPVVAAALRG
jgi:glycosyltransferase involved in cell wall biosynthesis